MASLGDLEPVNNLEISSVNDNMSAELLDPENVLVMSIVASARSSGFLEAEDNLDDKSDSVNMSDGCLFDTSILFIRSDRFNISVKSLPRIDNLFTNKLNVMESANSLFPMKFLDDESDICDVSDGDLEPENNRNIASVNKNASELDLDADIVLVVSIVARIMSDTSLLPAKVLVVASDNK